MANAKVEKPELQLSGEDGNVFNLMGLASKTARRSGWSAEEVSALSADLRSSGSYEEVLAKLMERFEVS